jgi:hypothetical protein
MEILITSSTLTIYDETGQSVGQWALCLLMPAMLWGLITAVRENNRARIEELCPPRVAMR